MGLSRNREKKLDTLPDIDPERPPLEWIKNTLGVKDGPIHIRFILQEIVKNLGLESIYDNYEPDENIRTAQRIVDDLPMFLAGKVTLNRYGNGAWAYLTLGDIKKAEAVIAPIIKYTTECQLSKATFYCASLIKIRQHKRDEALAIILNAGRWYNIINDPTFKSLHSLATQLN